MTATDEDLNSFFRSVNLPVLLKSQKEKIDDDIKISEVIEAIQSLSSNKAPGEDGFTTNFYKTFANLLADKLLKVYALPQKMNTSIITLLRKPDKDPLECGSYRPIQLLNVNVDQKILEKIIAARINEILPCVIHKDQIGFVQNRLVGDNMRKLMHCFYNAKTLTTPVVLFL